MNNLNKLPGMDLVSETSQGSFHVDTVSNPNPGFNIVEEWKDIEGHEGYFQVSNTGKIKRLEYQTEFIRLRKTQTLRLDERIVDQFISLGYKRVRIGVHGKRDSLRVQRIVAMALIPNPENKSQVNHIDGNKLNNHVDNLEWCTQEENCGHASRTGLYPSGERHYKSKLNKFKARVIRKTPDLSNGELGRIFDVNSSAISQVRRGITWKLVTTKTDSDETRND